MEIEEGRETPDTSLIIEAFENAIREFGSTSVECWAKYSEYLLRTAPEKVGAISQVNYLWQKSCFAQIMTEVKN